MTIVSKKEGNKCCILYIIYSICALYFPPTVVLDCYLGSKQPKSIYIHLYKFFSVYFVGNEQNRRRRKKCD